MAEVWLTKSISKDSKEAEYRDLLFRRCVLEYRSIDDEGEIDYSHNVHPLIEGIAEFKSAVEVAQNARK